MAQLKTSTKKTKKSPSKKPAPAAKKAAKRPEPVVKAKAIDTSKLKAKIKVPEPKPAARKPEPVVVVAPAKKAKPVQPLSKADLTYFRNLLLEKRREILGDVGSMESEAFKGGSNLSNMPIHMADVGTDNFEQEFTLGLIESERQILREIQDALARIDDKTFGICQGTGNLIPRVRLEAVPWAKNTIEYSRLLESGKIARDNAHSSDDDGGDDDED